MIQLLQSDLKHFLFQIVNVNNQLKIKVSFRGEHKIFDSVEILAMILAKMKESAEYILIYPLLMQLSLFLHTLTKHNLK